MAANTRLFFLSLLFGISANSVLYLGLIFMAPSPFKVGLWFWVYKVIVPYLIMLGIVGLIKQNKLDLPWQIATFPLIYALILAAWGNSFYIGLAGLVARVPGNSAELVPILLFTLMLVGLVWVFREEYDF
jgi:hypothetical protein